MKTNIILIGFMGSGKTTVGKQLAHHLNMDFLDMDESIQTDLHMTIQEIFEKKGEPFFRAKEQQLSKESSSHSNLVIATGGGIVLYQKNMDYLARNGHIIYLKCKFETIMQRIKSERNRPLFDIDNLSKFRELFDSRTQLYEDNAHFILKVDDKSNDIICAEILHKIKR